MLRLGSDEQGRKFGGQFDVVTFDRGLVDGPYLGVLRMRTGSFPYKNPMFFSSQLILLCISFYRCKQHLP